MGRLLLIQAVLSVLAALIENSIHVQENRRDQEPLLSLKTWWRDVREAADYLRQERGLHGLYTYMAVTNGMAMGYTDRKGGEAVEYSDHELVRGIKSGDKSALELLVRRWYPRIYGYVFKLTGHEQDAYPV